MRKRVTGNYYIPDLSKGLIDGSSKGRVDDNYKKKCSELTNFWIKDNNNIAKRPPLRPVSGLENIKHIIDVTETTDRIVFLRGVDLNIDTTGLSDEEARDARRRLLEEISWRPGVETEVGEEGDPHTDYISPDDPEELQVWHYGTAPDNVARDDVGSTRFNNLREMYPIVTVLDSYDKVTHEQYLDERYYFITWRFTTDTSTKSWKFGVVSGGVQADSDYDGEYTINRSYNNLAGLSKTALTDATRTGIEQARILREYSEGLAEAPVHTFIVNKGRVIDSRVIHNLKHHPEYGAYINEISTRVISSAALERLRLYDVGEQRYASEAPATTPKENLFKNADTPSRLFTNHSGRVELYAFGLDYIWDKTVLTPKIISAEDLSEGTMNTFVENPTPVSLDDIDIVADMAATVRSSASALTPGNDFRAGLNNVLASDSRLEDLITLIPDMIQVKDHLKFTLCNIANQAALDPTHGHYSYIVPDLQIPIQGTDIPAYGQFLFTVEYLGVKHNVFVAPYAYNQFYYATDNPTPFLRHGTEDGDDQGEIIRQYPNGYGTAQGNFGVFLALQTDNEIGTDGVPKFYPVLTDFPASATVGSQDVQARTKFLIRLGINLYDDKVAEIMDRFKLISFYSSRGQNGFNAVGAVQIGDYTSTRFSTERTEDETIQAATAANGFRDQSFGATVDVSTSERHLVPWGRADILDRFWIYAVNREPVLGANPRPSGAKEGKYEWNNDGSIGTEDIFTVLTTSYINNNDKREYLLDSVNNRARSIATGNVGIARLALAEVADGSTALTTLQARTEFSWSDTGRGLALHKRTSPSDSFEIVPASTFSADPDLYTQYTRGDLPERSRLSTLVSHYHAVLGVQENYIERTFIGVFEDIVRYYDNPSTTSVTVTSGSSTRTFTVNRDPRSPDYWEQHRQNFENEIAAVGNSLGEEFYPESLIFVNYHINTNVIPFEADNRTARAVDNIIAFSNTQSVYSSLEDAKFSQGYLRFLDSIVTAGRHSGWLAAANLGRDISIYDRTHSPSEPQSLILFNKDLSPVTINDYIETGRGGLIATDRRIYSVSGFNSTITARVIHESGFSGEALTDDSFVIGPEGDRLKAVRYYEEAGGYVTDVVNSELKLPGNVLQGVSLLSKHKVLLFRCENTYNAETGVDILYTLSVDSSRRVKGFTTFTVPCEISYLVRIDKDRVGIVTTDCEYLELDFSRDYNSEEGKWQDSTTVNEAGNPVYDSYECAFTPLPVLQVYADDFSVLKTTTLRYLVVGCSGHPAFDIQIVDGNTGRITRKTSFRRIRPNTVTVDSDFSGQVAVKNMPQNGSSQPELRISKTDDEYIEFSSINVQLGG